MTKKVIEASTAVALGVKLCRPAVIPMYPITPQTHIVERLSEYINDGELDSEMIHAESEHSAIAAAAGSMATGVRTFTATSSQGLALMHEILHIVSGMRLPVVMGVANRALSAPINIWNDHQDAMSARDVGWIQLYVESAQEALDTTIQAFKVAENKDILIPAMVCLDGFTLTHVFEPVDIPEQKDIDKFLPAYKPTHAFLDPKKPMTIGPIGYPDSFMLFKKEEHEALINALDAIKKANEDFGKKFGRKYGDGLIETYKMEDAQYGIVALGTICGTSRVAVDELRKEGKKIGLIKIRTFRPFPEKRIAEIVKNLKGLLVFDRDISPGFEGAVSSEIKASLYSEKTRPIMYSMIAGLGGKDVRKEEIKKSAEKMILLKKDEKGWLV